ncbi:hypothetical protein [Aquimonas voraii]|uniref:Uncharacterized protein n=1 Tax=Aquimonas voraii TaxID=265719 RepID=A0A1G6RN27_9GAMM|nr:hypothetical protein [Aquimonas voraii]SDD06080.1 hypothetical protein SAMN04488509_1019 [Aquimonas voraii]
MDYMLWRLPVPDWAAELLVDAWYEFEMLRHPSFLAALGLPDRDRLGAKSRSRVARDAVIMVIYRHNVRGIALKPFAFEEAAEFYGLSASVVEKAYYRMQKTEQFQMFEADAKGERRLEYCCPSPEMIEEERRRGR